MKNPLIAPGARFLQLFLLAAPFPGASAEEVRGSYLLDSKAVSQTPKYLGVCLEVADNAERSNLWDWLADSGAKMVRVVHPDKEMRLLPASESTINRSPPRVTSTLSGPGC